MTFMKIAVGVNIMLQDAIVHLFYFLSCILCTNMALLGVSIYRLPSARATKWLQEDGHISSRREPNPYFP